MFSPPGKKGKAPPPKQNHHQTKSLTNLSTRHSASFTNPITSCSFFLNCTITLMTCPATPETPRRRLSYLPATPMKSMVFEPSPVSTPMTPTHRLRPVESPCTSTRSISSLLEQSPCSTPNTPRRRLAALLDTPSSTAESVEGDTPKWRALQMPALQMPGLQMPALQMPWSDHSSTSTNDPGSPKRRLPQLSPLDDHPSASSCPSPHKRKAILSITQPLNALRKQTQSLKESILPPMFNDSILNNSSKLLEVSWSTFPNLSGNELDYAPEPNTLSLTEAQAVVDEAQDFVDDQIRYRTELDKCVTRFQKVARARLTSGSETGAFLAAKKVKKIEYEQDRVARAIGLVSDALTQMEREIKRARAESERSRRNQISFGDNVNVLEEAEAILSKRPNVKWEREKLLAEVYRWTLPTIAI